MAVQDAEFQKTDTPLARDKALKPTQWVANQQRSLDNVLIGIRHLRYREKQGWDWHREEGSMESNQNTTLRETYICNGIPVDMLENRLNFLFLATN